MKEVCAIIRPNKMLATKKALSAAGFPSMTACKVLGRGKQKGLAGEIGFQISPELLEEAEKKGGMRYVPKRMVSIVVNDEDLPRVIDIIIAVNQSGNHGDGRIFVLPIEGVIRVSTSEKGQEALI
ncbi:P-II family nitrogen regulator [Desulfovulcanus sp.]